MLSRVKMCEIIKEKDPEKQRSMIEKLSEKDKEKLFDEARQLHEATKAMLER